MRFVGGDLQGEFMTRVRGVDPRRCLAVPVDVGKWAAMALVADHHGEVVVAPFTFNLDEPGVRRLLSVIEVAVVTTDERGRIVEEGEATPGLRFEVRAPNEERREYIQQTIAEQAGTQLTDAITLDWQQQD